MFWGTTWLRNRFRFADEKVFLITGSFFWKLFFIPTDKKRMYVYIIASIKGSKQYYVGVTDNLERRLKEHNAGESQSTCKFRPWEIVWYCWFRSVAAAHEFEEYLKSGSGRTFVKRHFSK